MATGKFITLEGGEGTGKSTQVRLLAEALGAAGIAAHATREPGGTPGAEAIRALLVSGDVDRWDAMSEALLHFAARRDHVEKVVRPKLAQGTWIIGDRFADSTMAYQGCAQGLGREAVEALYRLTLGAFAPDLTLVLDVPVTVGLARAGARDNNGETRYERLGPAFHERLRAAFHAIVARAPDRCVLIDATESVEAVHAAVRAVVAERLGVNWP